MTCHRIRSQQNLLPNGSFAEFLQPRISMTCPTPTKWLLKSSSFSGSLPLWLMFRNLGSLQQVRFYMAINVGSAFAYAFLTTLGTNGGMGIPKERCFSHLDMSRISDSTEPFFCRTSVPGVWLFFRLLHRFHLHVGCSGLLLLRPGQISSLGRKEL